MLEYFDLVTSARWEGRPRVRWNQEVGPYRDLSIHLAEASCRSFAWLFPEVQIIALYRPPYTSCYSFLLSDGHGCVVKAQTLKVTSERFVVLNPLNKYYQELFLYNDG